MPKSSRRARDARQLRFSRRDFLRASALGTGTVFLTDPAEAAGLGTDLPTHRFVVRRASDLLALEFQFVNFEIQQGELVALGAGRSLIIVRFPPQNLAEALFTEPAPELGFEIAPLGLPNERRPDNSPQPPVRLFTSGPSWIVFAVPDGARLPFRATTSAGGLVSVADGGSVVDAWLRTMADWTIRIPANAARPGPPAMPRLDETNLEVPFRLFIAPTGEATRWLTSSDRHPFEPVPGSTRELWHAALLSRRQVVPARLPAGFRTENLPAELAPPTRVVLELRAVFSPDHDPRPARQPDFGTYYPGRMPLSLHALTRHLLVKQMAEGNGVIDAEHLILSALGADTSLSYTSQISFDDLLKAQVAAADGGQTKPAGVDQTTLAIWKHRIVVGRDVFFVEAFYGFLFPFVYPAIYVELTQRKFAARQTEGRRAAAGSNGKRHGPPGAYLLTERFILVQDPLKQAPDSNSSVGRRMPHKKATLRQLRSPLLEPPQDFPAEKYNQRFDDIQRERGQNLIFIPRILGDTSGPGGAPAEVRWRAAFEDESGQQAETSNACMLFADNVIKGEKIWRLLDDSYRTWSFPGQPVAYAPERPQILVSAAAPPPVPNQPQRAGAVVYRYDITDVERKAVRILGDAIRLWLPTLAGSAPDNQLQALKTQLTSGLPPALLEKLASINESVASLRNLRDTTVHAVSQAAAAILDPNNALSAVDKQAALEELLRQLGRAERTSATLETHALTFACNRVNKVYEAVQHSLAPLLSTVQSVEGYLRQVETLPELAAGEMAQLRKRIQDEISARVESVKQDWEKARGRIQDYVEELKGAYNQAKQFGTDYFQAEMEKAQALIPALKALAPDSPIREIHYLEDYIAKGISDVQNGVYAKLNEVVDQGKAMADQIKAGLARPAALVAGLSRDLGAVVSEGEKTLNDLARSVSGIDLKQAIPDAKLFGVLPLRDIIQKLARGQVPTINLVNLPDHFEHVWEWTTPLDTLDLGVLKFAPHGDQVRLHITFTTRVDLPKPQDVVQNKPPVGQVTLTGYLGNWDELAKKPVDSPTFTFNLILLGLIEVDFKKLTLDARYRTGDDVKPKLTPDIEAVKFLGPLQFIEKLESALKALGPGFQPEITPDHVAVRTGFQLPPISFGVVSLRNVEVGAGLSLSLTDKPLRFDFNFASWEKMFELSVLCFGGRGYFRAAVQSDGTRELEGAFEFGGSLSFDVVVASGGLYVVAGVYFKITNSTTDLAGYLRAGGNLQVLGLIHVSVEFLLMLRYRVKGSSHQLYGTVSITISIDLFLFSIDVTVTMEKEIEGSRGEQRTEALGLAHARGFFSVDVAAPPEPRLAYFTRPAHPPEIRETPGRFRTVDEWNDQYWSQFVLS